jgi:hypothetical protein
MESLEKESKEEGVNDQNDQKKTPNDPKMTPNDPKMTPNANRFKCNFCDMTFSTHAHKRRHELHNCKKLATNYKHSKDKKQWILEKKQLYKQIDALIAKAGNTTTNNLNIKLNSYGNEDLSHISESFKTGLLKGPFGMIPKMVKAVHFSDHKPENKNISLTNKKENKINIFKNGKWEVCKKSDILEDIMHHNYYLLDTHYDYIGAELLNEVQNLQYNKFVSNFKDGKLDKETKEDINLVIINGEL